MFEFLSSAFPWIIIGIAIAVFAANHTAEKKRPPKKDDGDETRGNRMSEGMCLGMCAGVVCGTTGICELALGISLGMLLGEVIGMSIKK